MNKAFEASLAKAYTKKSKAKGKGKGKGFTPFAKKSMEPMGKEHCE